MRVRTIEASATAAQRHLRYSCPLRLWVWGLGLIKVERPGPWVSIRALNNLNSLSEHISYTIIKIETRGDNSSAYSGSIIQGLGFRDYLTPKFSDSSSTA